MGKKIMRRCKVCGKEYEACYSCEKDFGWKMHTDTADHYYILCVLMDYQGGKNAKECFKALKKRGSAYDECDGYLQENRKLLDEIYAKSHSGRSRFRAAEPPKQTDAAAADDVREEDAASEQTEFLVGTI